MEIKYIPVHFSDGSADCSPVVTQWDRGQMLKITGLSLPSAAEFHFGNATTEQLLMVAGITENGVTTVQIPNALLCEPHNIYLYIYACDGDIGRTVYRIDLNMRTRLCPEEISSDPDDPHYLNGLSELIQSVSDATENINAAKAQIDEAAATATEQIEAAAAQAQAIADTLSPADPHYDPESWVAQSGTAVAEAIAEANDYTDGQIRSLCIMGKGVPEDTDSGLTLDGDFVGQFYLDTLTGDLYQFCFPDKPYNERWLRVINQNGIEELKYEHNSQAGLVTNAKEALDLLLGDVVNQVYENFNKVTDLEGTVPALYYNKEEIDEYRQNTIGSIETALDGIIAIQNSLIGGDSE